jgi:tetratricopeptide (TPR) repeat protein/tRNA A-37 threonylcarbamoyl transferase component Bud32
VEPRDAQPTDSPEPSHLGSAVEFYEQEKDRRRPATLEALEALRAEVTAAYPSLAERLRAYFANEAEAAQRFAEAGIHQPHRPEFIDVEPFGRYSTIEKEPLGWGGLSSVFKARDRFLGRNVALKIPLAKYAHDAEFQARLKREARIGGRLEHSGIVPVYELGSYGADKPIPYFTMKLIRGEELAKKLQERHSPSSDLPRFIQWYAHVCQAVGYAHDRGIIHRDIKPRNIMIGPLGEVQVTDWGLAKDLSDAIADTDLSVFFSDDQRQGMGTAAYAAPEQLLNVSSVGPQADVFSLGAVLGEILTGKPAYASDSPDANRQWIEIRLKAESGDLNEAWSRLDACGGPAPLVALAKECLSANPKDRPADAGAVSARVNAYLESLQQAQLQNEREIAAQAKALAEMEGKGRREAEEREQSERTVKQIVALLSAMIVLLVIVVGILFSHRSRYERELRLAKATKLSERLTDTLREQIEQARKRTIVCQTPEDLRAIKEAWHRCLPTVQQLETLHSVDQALATRGLMSRDDCDLVRKEMEQWDRLVTLFKDLQGAATLCAERQFEFHPDYERSAEAFAVAFQRFGVNLASGNATDTARSLRRQIPAYLQDEVVSALDLWALTGGDAGQHIGDVASQLLEAKDEWREVLRTAWRGREIKSLERLADETKADARPDISKSLLTGIALREMGLIVGRPECVSQAAEVLKRAQLEYPGDFWLNIETGNTYVKMTEPRLGQAAQYYRAALGVLPSSATAHGNLGLVLMQLGAADDAARCFEKARAVQNENLTALFGTALLELALHFRASEAEVACDQILSQRKDDANALALRGMARFLQGNLSQSKVDVDAAMNARSNQQAGYLPVLAKVITLVFERDYETAANLCRTHYDAYPNSQGSALLLAGALLLNGSSIEAEHVCRSHLQLPNEGSNRDMLGVLLAGSLLLQGRPEEAESVCRRVLQESPTALPANELLVFCLVKEGRYAAAKRESDAVAELAADRSARQFLAQWRSFWLTPVIGVLDVEGKLDKMDAEHPVGNGLDLLLAETALAQRRFRPARLLYQQSLRAAPKLAEGPSMLGRLERISHGINAAQAAIMDTQGLEESVAGLSSNQKIELRAWAEQLLRSEVDRLLKGKISQKEKHSVRRLLTFLSATPKLAAVRDNETLSQLGADEQRKWTQLWARVQSGLTDL